jgi:IclR family acetate operon transcriptional repressor
MIPADGARVKQETVRSLERAMSILEAVAKAGAGVTLSKLAADLRLPLSTVHRLLTTLEGRNFVHFERAAMSWRIGRSAVQLGANYTGPRNLVALARPIMQQFASRIDETASLGILDDGHVAFLQRVNPQVGRSYVPTATNPLPAYCSSIGKALLSMASSAEVLALAATTRLQPLTPNTIQSARHLLDDLDGSRQRGYAVDNEENTLGLCCIAAPLFDESSHPIAALSVSVPSSRLTGKRIGEIGIEINSIAAEITRSFVGSAAR